MADEFSQQTVAARQGPDGGPGLVVHPHRNERGEHPVLTDDTESAVPGVHEGDSRLDDASQHLLQIQPTSHGQHRFQKRVQTLAGRTGRVRTGLEPVQKLMRRGIDHAAGVRSRFPPALGRRLRLSHRMARLGTPHADVVRLEMPDQKGGRSLSEPRGHCGGYWA